MEVTYNTLSIPLEVDLIDFMPVHYNMDDEHFYGLTITCVRDEPREITSIETPILGESLEDIAERINALLATGLFDDKDISLETEMIAVEGENTKISWADYGVTVG